MKKILVSGLIFLFACVAVSWGQTDKPLRVFIRAGAKTHGPGQHDHPRFLKEWTDLLNQRGAKAEGAMDFPTADQLAATDVLILFAPDAGDISPEQREYLDKFLKRGGGIVTIHDAVCGHDAAWFKTVIGGAWDYSHAKFFEGDLSFYYLDHEHPITRGVSNFDFNDEEYYDLDLMPGAHVLAGTYQPDDRNKHDGRAMPSVYDVAPQMWTYEKDNYRSFVCIPGHNYKTFELPNFRAVLLRGIAWAGKREVDSLASREELATLRYPEGGPTAPEEAVKKLTVQPDFNIRLVASEPLIEKPISLDWDTKGRLWIAETPEYPFRKDRTRAPFDRISILEDTHGDGRMDKKTVFYEGLDLVTSMVFYKDGVIVSQAPHIIWVRSKEAAGGGERKVILYTGFGTNDTHAVISNLRWGMDGWIYATIGYTRADVYSGDKTKHFGRITDGVFRFRPDGSAIEQVSSKGSNTWGVDMAPDGEIFFSQANGNHIDHVVMPEAVLARGRVDNATSYLNIEDHNRSYPLMTWSKQAYVQIDWVGNFTAAAGCCVYDGGAWPAKYDYTCYVSEPTINIVHQDYLMPKGVSYVASKDPARLETEFIVSSDLWFRPIHERIGPDGAMYVLDFYNQAAVHNDTRGPRHDPQNNAAIRPDRDHYFGRIWRIQHNEAKKLEIPRLDDVRPSHLVKALEHPNEWVRMTALRLLLERGSGDVASQLEKLANSEAASPESRVHALWLLHDLAEVIPAKEAQKLQAKAGPTWLAALASPNSTIAKNALEAVELPTGSDPKSSEALRAAIVKRVNDTTPRVRLEAISALGRVGVASDAVGTLVKAYPDLKDRWLESAWLGAGASDPIAFIDAIFDAGDQTNYTRIAGLLAAQVGEKQDGIAAAHLVVLINSKPGSSDLLKESVLENLTRELGPKAVPSWTPELQQALRGLLNSTNLELSMTALPLAARWDANMSLAGDVKPLVQKLVAKLNDGSQSEGDRVQLAKSLIAVRQLDPEIVPSVARLLDSANPPTLQRRIIDVLGSVGEPSVGGILTTAYPNLPSDLQEAAFNQLVKRPDWSQSLLDAIESKKINISALGPVAINSLRTHNNKAVAERANKIIDAIRGPEMKEKDSLIAKFTPLVVQPGDPARGKQLFTQNCAICHKFEGQGKDVAPDLTGMGAHGPAELIVHVLDPNREVEPNYYAYSIETQDGEIYDGVIARENQNSVTLRNAAGDKEISVKNIKTRRNTGLSLMPNGFESLGGDVLRDILAYLCAGQSKYRILDLRSAFTANSTKGLWNDENDVDESLRFKKFGVVTEGGIPFEILNPLKIASGKNLIILKGGQGFSKSRPQSVEIKNINVKASQLHFLGGIGGWAYPWSGENRKGVPVVKVTVHYDNQQTEEIILKNGEDFADWIGNIAVPNSKDASDLVRQGQVRWFTKPLKNPGVIQSITLESYDNEIAPAFVAITAEMGDGAPAAAEPVSAAAQAGFKWEPDTTHVLIVGGGSSHDFKRWFDEADVATLKAMGKVSVNYTEHVEEVLPALKDVDVLYQCSNQAMDDKNLRQGIFDFVNAGHGLLLVHPGLWYNWSNWPEYNRVLAGGGAHGHDKYGEFEVSVKSPTHPVMAGVPETFNLKDELYHVEIDPQGTPIEVLAEGKNLATGKTYPVVWVVKHPKARIICITLGHDGEAHDLGAYKTILANSVKWTSGK